MNRTAIASWLVAGANLATGAAAWAAEEGGQEHPSLFTGNLGNAVWTLLTFGLVIYVLGKYAWKPILNGLQKREQFIRDSLEQARADRAEAEKTLARYAERLDQARAEASAIVEEARRDAEVVKRSIQEEARSEADAMIARASQEIRLARDTAVSELYTLAADLATDAAGRIIRRQLSPADHAELVRESIEEIRKAHEPQAPRATN
jgi:F-type H+-transporting ATPase subunit b